jgi:hypothetical protein
VKFDRRLKRQRVVKGLWCCELLHEEGAFSSELTVDPVCLATSRMEEPTTCRGFLYEFEKFDIRGHDSLVLWFKVRENSSSKFFELDNILEISNKFCVPQHVLDWMVL